MVADNTAAPKHSKTDAAASSPERAATDTSLDAQKAMREGGRDAAYDVLKKDYDSYVKDHGSETEQKKAYWDSASKQLGDILPDLTIAWGGQAAKTLHDAKDNTWMLMTSPDKTKIMNVLEPMSAAQRTARAGFVCQAVSGTHAGARPQREA